MSAALAPATGPAPATSAAPTPACVLPAELPADLVERLAGFRMFAGVEPAAVRWFVERSEAIRYPPLAAVSRPGDPVDAMSLVVEGRLNLSNTTNKGYTDLGDVAAGEVVGVLPFSRMTHAKGTVMAREETLVLRLPRARFTELVTVSYTLAQNLVAEMSDRIREFSELRAQDEKMMSLGKLSAGLAHELNNPSAAVVRSAEALYAQLRSTPESFKAIMLMQVTPAEVDAINEVIFRRLARLAEPDTRSAMARLEATEAIEDWLDAAGVAADDDTVESLVAGRFTTDDLDAICAICGGRSLGGLVQWVAKNVGLELLTAEIRDAAARISELVGSVKSYTHMDRAAGPQPLDVHEGLRTTLVMLKHKLKARGVGLVEDLDRALPRVTAWGGQINQVYTNLIDNAIDAAADARPGPGQVTLRTRARGTGPDTSVCIEIEDNGPGIPDEYRERIFDPFFTTKPVGEGTGMGLDIVQKILRKHDTTLEVESAPGRTVMRFCLR